MRLDICLYDLTFNGRVAGHVTCQTSMSVVSITTWNYEKRNSRICKTINPFTSIPFFSKVRHF